MALNPIRSQFLGVPQGGQTFNAGATGQRHYGAGGRPMPNIGKTADKLGYAQRDAAAAARRSALIRRAGL